MRNASDKTVSRLTMKLIKDHHSSELRSSTFSETEALVGLTTLHLEGVGIEVVENLEPFDKCSELYLHHNAISSVENLEHLGRSLLVLSLRNNRITHDGLRGLATLSVLEILDLADNRIALQLPSNAAAATVAGDSGSSGRRPKQDDNAATEVDGTDDATEADGNEDGAVEKAAATLALWMPKTLRVVDLTGNPLCCFGKSKGGSTNAAQTSSTNAAASANEAGNLNSNLSSGNSAAAARRSRIVRQALVRTLPFSREVDGRVVTLAERRAAYECLDDDADDDGGCPGRSVASFAQWKESPAGSAREHALFVPIQAEFDFEVDHTAKLSFRDGDDLERKALAFFVAHGVFPSGEAEDGSNEAKKKMCERLVDDMTEMIDDAPSASTNGFVPRQRFTPTAATREGEGRSGGGGGSESLDEFRARVVAFYSKYDPSKISSVDGILTKYGGTEGSRRKLLDALTKKYGPEPEKRQEEEEAKAASAFPSTMVDGKRGGEEDSGEGELWSTSSYADAATNRLAAVKAGFAGRRRERAMVHEAEVASRSKAFVNKARQNAEHAREGLKAARSEIQATHAELRENALGRISQETSSVGARLPYLASLEEEKWQSRHSGASSTDGSSSTSEAKEESKA